MASQQHGLCERVGVGEDGKSSEEGSSNCSFDDICKTLGVQTGTVWGNNIDVQGDDLNAVFDDSVRLIVAVHVSCNRNISTEDLISIVDRNRSMMFAHNRECSLLGAQK